MTANLKDNPEGGLVLAARQVIRNRIDELKEEKLERIIRITQLEEIIRRNRDLYYNSCPEITDAQFDAFVDELEALDPRNPVLSNVGFPASSPLSKVGHHIPMGSLSKTAVEDVGKWMESRGDSFVVQDKLDGISIAVYYEDGRLIRAVTRGDGSVGEDVTHNVRNYDGVKWSIPGFNGALRGEIILTKSRFRELFSEDYANPRNAVAGLTRTKVPLHVDLASQIMVVFYDVVGQGLEFAHEIDKTYWMRARGLHTPITLLVSNGDSTHPRFLDVWDVYTRDRDTFSHEIDGVVLKVNHIHLQDDNGEDVRPTWATAVKFPAQSAETVLKAVDWQLGVGGRLTPVARLQPVQLAGVTVSNATLHNWQYIQDLGLSIEARVVVERAGDVIPQVTRMADIQPLYMAPILCPVSCPACEQDVSQDGRFIVCPHENCPGKVFGAIQKWVTTLDIVGIGEQTIRSLISAGLVSTPGDLYRLVDRNLLGLDGIQEKTAENIVQAIAKSRTPSLATFLAGVGIPQFSLSRAQAVVDAGYDDLHKICYTLTAKDIESIDRFGPILANQIVRGLAHKTPLLQDLIDAGVHPIVPEKGTNVLGGKSFCFTGAVSEINPDTVKKWTRDEMQALVRHAGGVVRSGVSAELDYLVISDPSSTSSKAKKARDIGVVIIRPSQFFSMVS